LSFGRYALIVAAMLGASLGALVLLFGARMDPATRNAALVGALLAGANTLLAYFLVVWSQPRSTHTFLAAVLGGMVGRMGLLLAAVVAAVLVLGLPKVPLAVSLLSYFVVFLAFELTLLHRRTSRR
jgi:hypothetical protein